LLVDIGFDGTGNYLKSKGKKGGGSSSQQQAEANGLAGDLDDYNNNEGIDVDNDGNPDSCLP
jgi:hypothetical protein